MTQRAPSPVSPIEESHRPHLGGSNGSQRRQSLASSIARSPISQLQNATASSGSSITRQPSNPISINSGGHQTQTPPNPAGAIQSQSPTNTLPTQSSPTQSGPGSSIATLPRTNTVRERDWLPFTLRWYFVTFAILISLGLGVATVILCWYSTRHYGLGYDDGSSAILFGWRFTPTLIAVLFTQVTVTLFEDLKRTEPFTRLASAPAGGASAVGTILHTPKAWWGIFWDAAFRRKKNGKTSWALLCIAFVNITALLAISPLSSALLTSEEVAIPRTVPFTRISLKPEPPIQPTRDTSFRIIASVMRNISTSAWATDSSFVLPFWPKKEEQQFDPTLNSTYRTWKAETTALQASFECQNMTISQSAVRKPYEIVDSHGDLQKGIQPMVVFNISSADGCEYELTLHPASSQLSYGGMLWSDTSVLHETGSSHMLQPGHRPAPEEVFPMSPFVRFNSTEQCRNREIIIANTAWTKQWLFDGIQYIQGLPENATYEQRSDFKMRALLCDTRYSMADRSMSASISSTETVLENAPGVQGELKKIPENMFNTTRFRESSLHDKWRSYVLRSRYDAHAEQNNETRESGWAEFTGLSAVLGAFYSYNLSNVIDEPRLVEMAAKIRGRIFAETMQDIVTTASAVNSETMEGVVANVENRVVVITEVGVTIAVLFFTSSILLLLVLWFSRLTRRPLNLQSDPASTVGMASLLDPGRAKTSTLKIMHKASKNDLYSALRRDKYSTFGSALLSEGSVTGVSSNKKTKKERDWRPVSIHLRTLLALAFFLSLILIAILILNAFSEQSRLSQLAFIYEADVSKFGLSFKTFAPISIVPTVVSIIIGLWWDQLDQSFRILQPYIAQSRSPTPIHSGAGLTYRSKTWMGAAIKALKHRHFVLFTICLGSTLCQVLTVSMSALFERKPDIVSEQVPINRTLELRQVPIITDITSANTSGMNFEPRSLMDGFFEDFNGNFLDGATVEVMTNASKLAWSHNEWSFIPVDLSVIPDMDPARRPGDMGNKGTVFSPANVTVNTPAIRARLECSVIEEMADQNSWMATYEQFRTRERNQSITLLKKRYGIKSSFFEELKSSDSDSESKNTVRDFEFGCCVNETEGNFGMATIAYWSVFNSTRESLFGGQDSDWPVTFIPKWIRGKGRLWNDEDSGGDDVFVFEEVPRMQAARCSPIIETAAAAVTVEKQSKAVKSYRILNSPVPADSAWMEVLGRHQPTPMTQSYSDGFGSSITTSYGVLFFLALFSLVEPTTSAFYQQDSFRIVDREFGMNMDYISYAMFLLAGKDQDALLNYDTLVDSANRTLQTYFQHYVANKLSLQDGGFAYQKIGDNSMDSLPPAVDDTWKVEQPEKVYPSLNTNRGGIALVTNRIQILHMNSVATYLSAAILIWLIGTSVVVAALQRRYTRYMLRNVDSIADVLVLVAGSENFLSLVQQRGLTLRRDRDIKTKLGWFKGKDGEVRWGVEIVGGPDAVEWVDSPANAAAIAKKPNFVRRTTGGLIKVVTRGKTSKTNVATSP